MTVDCDGGACWSVFRPKYCEKQEPQCWEGRIARERKWAVGKEVRDEG